LKYFNIRDTQLKKNVKSTFQSCDQLIWLDASDNRIRILPANAFVNCQQLEIILLDNNNIIRIDPCNNFVDKLKDLKELSMRRNACINFVVDENALEVQRTDARMGKLRNCYNKWVMFKTKVEL